MTWYIYIENNKVFVTTRKPKSLKPPFARVVNSCYTVTIAYSETDVRTYRFSDFKNLGLTYKHFLHTVKTALAEAITMSKRFGEETPRIVEEAEKAFDIAISKCLSRYTL